MVSFITPSQSSIQPLPILESVGLARLACYAATELDRLLAYPASAMPNVARLREFITGEVQQPESGSPDLATIAVLTWAFSDSKLFEPSPTATIDDLVAEAAKVLERLSAVESSPDVYRLKHPELVIELRELCLTLSKEASAYEYSGGGEEPEIAEHAFVM